MNAVISLVEPSRWDDLVARFPDRTVFHHRAWLEALAAAAGHRVILAQAEDRGRCVGVWPALALRKGPLQVLGSPFPGSATPYLGPLFDPQADRSAVAAAFLAAEPFRGSAYLACRTIDRDRPVDLAAFGFAPTRRFVTYRLDLTRGEERLWAGLKSECRTRIRKARSLGIDVRRETDAGFIDDFWTMSLETFQRSGSRPTYDLRLVTEVWKRLAPEGRVLVLSAFHRGERVSTLVLPQDDRTIYYWGGASFLRHRSLPAGNLLHWHAILAAREAGLAEYDLISTNGGPGRFKRSFGAVEVPMATHWERSRSRLVGFLRRQYERYRRLRLGIPLRPAAGGGAGLQQTKVRLSHQDMRWKCLIAPRRLVADLRR